MHTHIEPGSPRPYSGLPRAHPSIQPHGVLLVVDAGGRAVRVAGDTRLAFGRAPQELLGKPLATAFDPHAGPGPDLLRELSARPRYVGSWSGDHGRWDITGHRLGEHALLEFEPAAELQSATELAVDLCDTCEALRSAPDVRALCRACAQAIRRLTGFDHVAIYRLAGQATVAMATDSAATASICPRAASPDPALPCHAWDRARFVYIRNIGYQPAPLLPIPADGALEWLDIGICILRGIPPASQRHLESVGVAAWASLPVDVRGEPWGVVTCHDAVPRPLPCAVRKSCELVLHAFASRIEASELGERLQHARSARRALREQSELLVQEVNHRVQNSLQMMVSTLQLQARQADHREARSQLEAAAGRIAAVGTAHRQLSPSKDGRTMSLGRYLTQLCTDLALSWGEAWHDQLTVDAGHTRVAGDTAITLGLVVTELLTNAVKYAYRGTPGPVGLTVRKKDQWLHVTVSDRGYGMRQDSVGGGLGSRLVRIFTAQLGGEMDQSSSEAGTTVTVRVPLPSQRRGKGDTSSPLLATDAG